MKYKSFASEFFCNVAVLCIVLVAVICEKSDAQMYAMSATGELYTISTEDASLDLIFDTGVAILDYPEQIPATLAYNSRNGLLYSSTVGRRAKRMFTINPITGQTIDRYMFLPGSAGAYEGGLAVDDQGIAYLGHQGPGSIRVMELETGQFVRHLELSGPEPHDISGMVWRDDGMLVGIDGRNYDNVVEVDPETGVVTALSPLFRWISIPESTS